MGGGGRAARVVMRLPSFLAVALLLVSAGCNGGSSKPTTARAASSGQPIPVGVVTAEKRDLPVYLSGLGSVLAFNTVSVKSRSDGQLVQVNFKEGLFVKQGEQLALIDPRPYEVALSQAQATLFRDQAQLRDARLNYERFKSLLQESGAMSQQQVDTQRATADQLEGAVRADQAAIDQQKLNLAYCHITAPIGGRIGIRLVDVGNMVHAADTNPMLVITQLQPVSVLFTLPEDSLPTVAQHMRNGTLEVDAYSRDDQTKLATGKLLTIDNQIDQSTGTGRLKAVFDNKDNILWPNQFVNVRQLPVSALPEVDYPTIQVVTFYPGADPDVMASSVTAPLERQFGQVPGLTQMSSTSSLGSSLITLQFGLEQNIDVEEQQVQAAINAATTYLPRDLPNPPIYSKVNPADAPILTLALSSDTLPLSKVEDLADTALAQKISQLPGVGLVSINGGQGRILSALLTELRHCCRSCSPLCPQQ